MNNNSAKLRTPGQWLLKSMGWTGLGVGSWLAIGAAVLEKPYTNKLPAEPWFFIGFAAAHGLLWWRAVPGLAAELAADKARASWLEAVAFAWLVGLVAFQLISLGVMLLALAAVIF